MSMAPTITLASNSPRRRQLLALTGWAFTVRAVEIDEQPLPGEPPRDYVLRLAQHKALASESLAGEKEIILTADTTVADGMRILGKPAGAEEAREMLLSLRGREHTVFTAIGVLGMPGTQHPASGRLLIDLCAARVWMRAYSDAEIEAYIASGDPFDKAGAYAIQNQAFHPVERIEGCYACIVGLPVCHVIRALEQFGLQPPAVVPAACPAQLEEDTPCQVYEEILRGQGGEPGRSQF